MNCFLLPAGSKVLRMLVALASGAMTLISPPASLAGDLGLNPAKQHALLVGCTIYPNNGAVPELYGPGNDVPAWAEWLTDPKGFGFPPANVTTLLGWPDEPGRRPTRANIAKAFETLASKAKPDDRIFILLSGHGSQVPIPPDQDSFDPKNFEPDGLDEVFLPADVEDGERGSANIIKDDDLGVWLDKIRDKGAHVLIVFDCCHSGTMTRGDDLERPRVVRPQVIGVKDERLAEAVQRAERARKDAEAAGRDLDAEARALAQAGGKTGQGSMVAFYAAQSFETAPELPLPEGAPRTKDHYFGLLSYTLLQTLEQRHSPISYHDLGRLLAAHYRATRGTRAPTPFCEGDLDREVLGFRRWPVRPDIVLERQQGKLQVSAGEFLGLTQGSVLAVRRPAGMDAGNGEILGHVRVVSTSPTTAIVTPTAYGGQPAAAAEALPDLGCCELVSRDFGDMRVKLFASGSPVVAAALAAMARDLRDLINTSVAEDKAEWVLRPFPDDRAAREFGLTSLGGDHVLLYQGQGRRLIPAAGAGTPAIPQHSPPPAAPMFLARSSLPTLPVTHQHWPLRSSATCPRSLSGKMSGASSAGCRPKRAVRPTDCSLRSLYSRTRTTARAGNCSGTPCSATGRRWSSA